MAVWMFLAVLFCGSHAAVLPPPWADIRRNPCAAHPRGWLMLYWPSDGKCYTIYKKGHPCPESQELSPGRLGGRTIAECKCPPGSAQLPHTTTCHKLFEKGPCRNGEYFAPVEESFNIRGERQGMCVRPQACADDTLLYWPPDGKCHYRRAQGPCYLGAVLTAGDDGLANCTCKPESSNYWAADGGCYAHYTRGPCERGQLFQPGGRCGCDAYSPHYHNETNACYELDSIGPCPRGHTFSLRAGARAACRCRAFHARAADGACYRLYTRGPCAPGEMVARGGKCTKVLCRAPAAACTCARGAAATGPARPSRAAPASTSPSTSRRAPRSTASATTACACAPARPAAPARHRHQHARPERAQCNTTRRATSCTRRDRAPPTSGSRTTTKDVSRAYVGLVPIVVRLRTVDSC